MATAPELPVNDLSARALLAGTVILLLVLYYPTLAETARICWTDEDYSHGLLLPFISLYFIWTNRDSIAATAKETVDGIGRGSRFIPSWLGYLLLLIGMMIFLLGDVANLLFIRWASFFPAFTGLLFLALGPTLGMSIATPLLLNFMAKPLPDSLVPKLFFPLQVMAAQASAWVLNALQVPVYLKGNIIEIPGMQLMVEEACSGLRSLMALITVALIVLYSIRLPFYAKVIMVFASVLIAIGLNVVRVAATGLLAHFYDPSAASGFFHEFSGMVVFLIGLGLLYGFGAILSKLTAPKQGRV